MKNAFWTAMLSALALMACDSGTSVPEPPADDGSTKSVFDDPAVEPAARVVNAEELLIAERSPLLMFRWRAPAELGQAPDLLDKLREAALAEQVRMSGLADDTAKTREQVGADGDIKLFWSQEWDVAFENDTLLNLVSELETYEGGAHGMRNFGSVLYDKSAEREIAFRQLFANWPEVKESLAISYCEELNAMRLKRRGTTDRYEPGDDFAECPPIEEQPVRIDTSNFGNADSFTVMLAPYEAGPYAEGVYEVEIPLDEDLRAALKSEYFPAG